MTEILSIELDDETLRHLAVLGDPTDVLRQLALSLADTARTADARQREQTDESLRMERETTDAGLAEKQTVAEQAADEVIRLARLRADEVIQSALDRASDLSEAATRPARTLAEQERAAADAMRVREREKEHQRSRAFLAAEREATDKDLDRERGHVDNMLLDQREANTRMVSATIRAQELRDEADKAKVRAERNENELRRVAEFRERFIAILGHDLRNPLGSIAMCTALMIRGGQLNERDADAAERIVRSGQRMTRMISQLLDLTRARLGGGLPIEMREVDLRDVCRQVIEELPVAIALDVEGDVTGYWDPDRLAEVLSNLAGNAIEYSAPGSAILIQARSAGTDAVVVEVTNHGDPIPADVLPFIFEPFRRAQQDEKSAAGNLGLGLYIAQQVVLAHGGTLEAQSTSGTTTFTIRLPRRVVGDR